MNTDLLSQEVRMRNGNKKIFHLEAWVVKVMSLYKVKQIDLGEHLTNFRSLQHFFYDIDMSEFD
jgi:hypothetical protein